MRMSELAGKELINLSDGRRLGQLGDCDLVVDPESGNIDRIVVPQRGRLARGGGAGETEIPWTLVRRIGPEVIIVELGEPEPAPPPGVPRKQSS